MHPNFFEEIIFPPLVKAVVEPSAKNTIHNSGFFDFWFLTVIDRGTREQKLQLVGACPKCDTSFIIKDDVKSEILIRDDLKRRGTYYIIYVETHCPRCNPTRPIDAATMMRAIL
jgi:hypothetical protein